MRRVREDSEESEHREKTSRITGCQPVTEGLGAHLYLWTPLPLSRVAQSRGHKNFQKVIVRSGVATIYIWYVRTARGCDMGS